MAPSAMPVANHISNEHIIRAKELKLLVSADAEVLTRGDDGFEETVLRWQKYKSPSFDYAIKAKDEADIVAAIQFANRYSIPFLAVVSGHGCNDLSAVRNGLHIDLRHLNTIEVDSERNEARIGGGALIWEVVEKLAKYDKQTGK